jgi:hypothetical protein
MNYRRWAAGLEWSLAALVVCLHLAAIGLAPGLRQDGLAGMLICAVPFCQLVLLLAWWVLGPGPATWRIWSAPVLLIGGSVAWAWMWQERGSGINQMDSWLLLTTGIVFCCLVVGARTYGLTIRWLPNDRGGAIQYSVRGLLALTTVVAIAIGVLERLRPVLEAGASEAAYTAYVGLPSAPSPQTGTRLLVLAVSIAGISWAVLWSILRPGSPWIRLLTTAAMAAALGVYLSHLSSPIFEPPLGIASQLLVLILIVGGTVLPARLMGFRLATAPRVGRTVTVTMANHAEGNVGHALTPPAIR